MAKKGTGSHLKIEKFGSNCMGIELTGDIKKPEYDLFLVKFPGGEVEITRTPDGDYWIHTIVNSPNMADGSLNCGKSKIGYITDSRAFVKSKRDGKITDIAVRVSIKSESSLSAELLENPEMLLMQLLELKNEKKENLLQRAAKSAENRVVG
ncbi:hypothetical protein [Pseudanabaena sp. 'Roaring Creek']|uniref:hypothetical protein n=1 Tax=Pseudanabaena sp. 'Roaring Creek' TaxID=1681830 RepID=UPI0012E10545|nr:hypothetical protein [Pseudanabaena sp. 'Roaring Creek']